MGPARHSRAGMHLNNHRKFSRNPRGALTETAAEISEPTPSTRLTHREPTPSRRTTPSQETAVKTRRQRARHGHQRPQRPTGPRATPGREAAEKYIHLANPWLLPAAVAALAAAATPPALALLAAGAAALALRPYRTWAAAQLYLMAAAVRNLRDKELIWDKQDK